LKEIFQVANMDDPEIMETIKKGFTIKETDLKKGELVVEPKLSHKESFDQVLRELKNKDFYPLYKKEGDRFTLRIASKKRGKKVIRPLLHGVLLIATIITVTIAGYIWWAGGDLQKSMLFTIGLMGILGGHELGHALVARKNSVDATLPFFLPVPPFFAFGTLGAVIFMNSPIPDRKSLFDIGIAGPLTGFILSFPVLVVGIALSSYKLLEPSLESLPFLLGTPPLFNIITNIIHGAPEHGFVLLAHPIAIAGWAGIFVTALNLLPMGQLDGGHVIRSVFPRYYKDIYRIAFIMLFLMGSLGVLAQIRGPNWLVPLTWPGWLFWAVLVLFMTRLDHPGPLNDVSSIDAKRKLAAVLMLIIFIVSFTPVPIVQI
jgi:membrane-associated protease RseP (regulator of RpoE activity)